MKMMGEIFNEISNPWLNIFNQNLFFLKVHYNIKFISIFRYDRS